MASSNLFSSLPTQIPDELFVTLFESAHVRVEKIISHGHASPDGFWYDQDEHEWVVVLKGMARLTIEEELVELKPGDFVNISAHQKHRVEWTTPTESTVWLAVFYSG